MITNEDQKKLNEDLFKAIARVRPLEEIEKLIEKGADVNAINEKDEMKTTPLVWCRTAEQVEVLVGAGADVDYQSSYNGMTALMWASQKGNTETVEALIDEGADYEASDISGRTAISYAGNLDTLKVFIDKGADPFKQDVYGTDVSEYISTNDIIDPEMKQQMLISLDNYKNTFTDEEDTMELSTGLSDEQDFMRSYYNRTRNSR
ncbi:MAG: ankyrin repeat domain-containing protein [Acetobacter sp.]|nr:ankyrin repeat domain-containing protein [Acetobacter sp.]